MAYRVWLLQTQLQRSGGREMGSVAVVGDINEDGLLPAEQEVAGSGPESDGHTQPHVVRHEDQHEEVADDHLYDVQKRLEAVTQAQHGGPTDITRHETLLGAQNKILWVKAHLAVIKSPK